jgi:hypothetical protein
VTLILAAGFIIVSLVAIGEAVLLRRLTANVDEPDELEKPTDSECGLAMVNLLCVSILEKPEQWTFRKGLLKHSSGTVVSLTADGQAVMIKRGKDTTIVDGADGARIRDAVLTRNLRVSFEGIAKELA